MKYTSCGILLVIANMTCFGPDFSIGLLPGEYELMVQDQKNRSDAQKIDTLLASGMATKERIKEINEEPCCVAFRYIKPEWVDPLAKLGFYLSAPLAYNLATTLAEHRQIARMMSTNREYPEMAKRKDVFIALLVHCKNPILSENLIKVLEKADLPITPYRPSMLAFLMATHPRTGALSPAKDLPIWVIREIDKWVPYNLFMRDLW